MNEKRMLETADTLKRLRDRKDELQARLKEVQARIDETEAQLVEEAPHRRVVVDPHKTLAAYGREGTCTSLVVERHKHVAQVENHIAVFHLT